MERLLEAGADDFGADDFGAGDLVACSSGVDLLRLAVDIHCQPHITAPLKSEWFGHGQGSESVDDTVLTDVQIPV